MIGVVFSCLWPLDVVLRSVMLSKLFIYPDF